MGKPKTMNIILAALILLTIAFTVVIIWIFYKTGQEPVVLVGSWFAMVGAEFEFMKRIKIEKIKKGEYANGQGLEIAPPDSQEESGGLN
jgi:hypothetical protein